MLVCLTLPFLYFLRFSIRRRLQFFFTYSEGNRRHFKFSMWVEHSKSQPTDDKPSLKWAWSRHVTHFKFLAPPPKLSLERLKLETSNLVCMLIIASPSLRTTKLLSLKGAWSLSRDLFNFFLKISENILQTVQYSIASYFLLNSNRSRMHSIEWLCWVDWVIPNHLKPGLITLNQKLQ